MSNEHRTDFNAAKRFPLDQKFRLLTRNDLWPPTQSHGYYFFINILIPVLDDKNEFIMADVVAQGHKVNKSEFCDPRRTVEQAVNSHLTWLYTKKGSPLIKIKNLNR